VYLSAFLDVLDRAALNAWGDKLGLAGVFLGCALLSLTAIPFFYLGGNLGRWTGRLLGGTASSAEVRAAIAWATVPMTEVALLSWAVQLALFGGELFSAYSPRMDATPPFVAGVLVSAGVIAALWSSLVGLKCFAEAHRFSVWRALGTGAVSLAVVVGPIVGLVLAASLLAPS
jgi:hypothetical protein